MIWGNKKIGGFLRKTGKAAVSAAMTSMILGAVIFPNNVYGRSLMEATPENPYKVAAIGDSITFPYSYATVIDALPIFEVKNFGVPGSQVAGTIPESFYSRAKDYKENPDLILVMGGTNDYCAFATLAKDIGPLDSTDVNTFCGAYNTIIKRLKANNKKSRIVLITPTVVNANDYKNIYGYSLKNYADAVKMIAASNGLPCIDLYNNPELNFADPSLSDLLMDPVHPNAKGQELIADEVLKGIAAAELFYVDNSQKLN